MKTITPFELQMLIYERHVEVIDVRPRRDFEKSHVLVARSIPLKTFEPHSVLAHRRFKKEPLYIMGQGKAQASLVAGSLAAAGLAEPIVVEGGVKAWQAHRLPLVYKGSWPNWSPTLVHALSEWSRRLRRLLARRSPTFALPNVMPRWRSA